MTDVRTTADLVGNLITRLEGLRTHMNNGLINRKFCEEQLDLAIQEAKQLDQDPAPIACLHPKFTRSVNGQCTDPGCHNYYATGR